MSTARKRLGRFVRPVVAFAAIVVVLAPATAAQADPTPSQIDSQIQSESAKLEQTVETFNQVTEELNASKATAERLIATITPLATQADQASELVTQLAVRAYQGGALAEYSSVLASADPSAAVDRLLTLDQVTRIEKSHIAAALDSKTRYDVEAAKYAQIIADQTAQQNALAAQKQEIDANLAHLYDLRRAAYGSAQTSGARYTGPIPAVSGAAGAAVAFAYGAIGTPYVWAGESANGYDCSGLTKAAWAQAGVSLPHNAAMQWNVVAHIGRDSLAPGDLVFYSGLGHVAIYVGGGQIIHAPSAGDHVRLASVDMMTPYGYGRPVT